MTLSLAPRASSENGNARRDRIAVMGLLAICVLLFVTLRRDGDIWWMDASRHALNGAFVLDLVKEMPFSHPVDFAFDYYRRLPALTILFYPPLFYVFLALAYSVLGVTEQSALIVELGFLFLLGWGAFRLSRHYLDTAGAFAAAVLTIGAPEVCFWGRQVMLDIPAYALLIWAAERHVAYLRSRSAGALLSAAVLLDAAIYMKYNAAFLAPVMAVSLAHAFGWRSLWDRAVLRAAIVGAVILVPLAVVFVAFSKYNLEQAASVADAAAGRWSIDAWTYYLVRLPEIVSWPTLIFAAAAAVGMIARPAMRPDRAMGGFLIIWLVIGYVFYSLIALKEPRHFIFVIFPIALAAVAVVSRVAERWPVKAIVPIALAATVLTISMTTRPAPFVTGMREAATRVAEIAPPETNIAFFGRLDGTFVFAMRAYSAREDLGVARLDKLLFSGVAVSMERGYQETMRSSDELVAVLRDLHVQYVVFQTGYLSDLANVRALREALGSDRFHEAFRVPMTSNYPFSYISELLVYRMTEDVPRGRVSPRIQIQLLGRTI